MDPRADALQSPWTERTPLVILGAGQGTRLGGACKLLLPLGDWPTLLDRACAALSPLASDLRVVVSEASPQLDAALRRTGLPAEVHLQPEPRGTLAALLALEPDLPERFVVALGDCLFRGRLHGPADPFPGLVLWDEAGDRATRANFGVARDGARVTGVLEKPGHVGGLACGVGIYLLDRPTLVGMADTPPDDRGRRELTSGIARSVAAGTPWRVVSLSGDYVNVNTPEDLAAARARFGVRAPEARP